MRYLERFENGEVVEALKAEILKAALPAAREAIAARDEAAARLEATGARISEYRIRVTTLKGDVSELETQGAGLLVGGEDAAAVEKKLRGKRQELLEAESWLAKLESDQREAEAAFKRADGEVYRAIEAPVREHTERVSREIHDLLAKASVLYTCRPRGIRAAVEELRKGLKVEQLHPTWHMNFGIKIDVHRSRFGLER
jgi:hypothetical protein